MITASVPRAAANGLPSCRLAATRIEPTSAVPSEEPRLETLRERPEISPWSASGKLDCTTLTEAVSMIPTPAPISSRPGTQPTMPECGLTSASSRIVPTIVSTKPAMISERWACRLAILSARAEAARMPIVAGVSISPVWIAL
jgi:hypothetical protein